MRRKWDYTLMVFLLFFSLFAFCYGEDYRIGAEDVIEVAVWKEPDFSREVLVRPDGKISLPVIGDIQAEGLTPEALTKDLQEAFAKYVKTPKVSVIVSAINSRKIYVLGRVRTPGVFPLRSEMTLLQAIAIAGGFSEWAKKGDIILLRKAEKGDQRIEVDLKNVIQGKEGGEDVPLQPGDKIIVP